MAGAAGWRAKRHATNNSPPLPLRKQQHHQTTQVSSPADNAAFCALLRRLVDEHAPVIDSLARGLREAKARALVGPALQLDSFLDSMLRSRITRRVLAEHHFQLSSSGGGGGGSSGGGGVVDGAVDVAAAAEFAGQRAAMLCSEVYGAAPEVRVSGDLGAALPYIPSHLDYMLYELLKNAVRATAERHLFGPSPSSGGGGGAGGGGGGWAAAAGARAMPPVLVRVCAGRGAISVRISDAGGGVPEAFEGKVWAYGFTTSDMAPAANGDGGSGGSDDNGGSGEADGGGGETAAAAAAAHTPVPGMPLEAPAGGSGAAAGQPFGLQLAHASEAPRHRHKLAGLGFGLPLSRLYARYFGGDLSLQNLPGHGVDAYLTLRSLEALSGGWREADHHA